jgi:hypothetical protein
MTALASIAATIVYLARCKTCRATCRVVIDSPLYSSQLPVLSPALTDGDTYGSDMLGPAVLHTCGQTGKRTGLMLKRVQARVRADIRCGARCWGATRPDCECSCGGTEHGKAHG